MNRSAVSVSRMGKGYIAGATSLHWADLGTPDDRAGRERLQAESALLWRRLVEEGDVDTRSRFADGVWVESDGGRFIVRWSEPERRAVAEAVCLAAPEETPALLGVPALGWEAAAAWVLRTQGVDLTTCEVRVGLTRGHLLVIVFSIPLDVAGSPEVLDRAVEEVCERALGEVTLDRWIVSIDVVRSARRSRLSVLPADGGQTAETHPAALLCELVKLGIAAVLEAVPESRLSGDDDAWTALELTEETDSPQGDRLQAFTNVPEALKAALEGLPFDSARFTRGREVMIWCAWQRSGLESRILGRELAEAAISTLPRQSCAVCGSGFGPHRDFLDLWVLPEVEVLRAVRQQLATALGVPIDLGFYDSHWSHERFLPWPSPAA